MAVRRWTALPNRSEIIPRVALIYYLLSYLPRTTRLVWQCG
jgi:hypothetical protein